MACLRRHYHKEELYSDASEAGKEVLETVGFMHWGWVDWLVDGWLGMEERRDVVEG